MYECLVGYPPFYAEDPMSTCRKIVNWRKTLVRFLKARPLEAHFLGFIVQVFPDEAKLSPESVDLMKKCALLDGTSSVLTSCSQPDLRCS